MESIKVVNKMKNLDSYIMEKILYLIFLEW